MNHKLFAVLALSGLATAAAGVAQAAPGHDRYDRYERSFGRYESDEDFARVVDVVPLVERVRRAAPVEQCWDESTPGGYRSAGGNERTGATLAGGILGAVVGHQIGSGSGRKVATVAGTLLGAAIGNNAARGGDRDEGYYEEPRYRERCEVRDEVRFEERVRAYRVTYRYHGRDYVTELPYDPGPRLRVAVEARPL
jgi:uncharacterized protein YcfJ